MLKNFSAICLLLALFLTALIFLPVTKDNFLVKETVFYIFIGLGTIFSRQKIFADVDVPFLFFFLAILLSLWSASFPFLVLSFLWYIFNLYLGYSLARNLPEKFRQKIPDLLWLIGFLIGVYGLLQHSGFDLFLWASTYSGRPASSFGNPNFFAGYLVVMLPLLLADLQKKNYRLINLLIFFLLLLNLYWTRTRGAWLAAAVTAVFYFTRRSLVDKKRWSGWLAAALFLIVFGLALIFWPGLRTSPSVAERIFKWQTAIEMVRQHPFSGVGANNLKVNFALYQTIVREKNNLALRGTSESNVHNEYCQIAAETGIIGLFAFLLIFIWYFRRIDSQQNSPYSAAVLGFAFFSLTNFPLHIVPTALLFFVAMGLAQRPEENKDAGNFRLKVLGWLVFFVLLDWFLAIRPFIADYYRARGDRERDNKNYLRAIDYYQKSIELDREHSERTAYDLGEIYRLLGDYQKAIAAYEISISLRNYAELYNNIGNCYYLLSDLENARKNWQKAYELKMPTITDQKLLENNLRQIQKRLRKE